MIRKIDEKKTQRINKLAPTPLKQKKNKKKQKTKRKKQNKPNKQINEQPSPQKNKAKKKWDREHTPKRKQKSTPNLCCC